jgi:hypothetical protein
MKPLDELYLLGSGRQYPENRVYLDGIDKFLVQQSKPNDCWAAALETARRYLHLYPVSQGEMIEAGQQICPRLKSQPKGADTYQIAYIIAHVLSRYDIGLADPHFCVDAQCIVVSLLRDRPVIMLRSGHAVLVVGADFLTDRDPTRSAKALVVVKRFKILDPDPTRPEMFKAFRRLFYVMQMRSLPTNAQQSGRCPTGRAIVFVVFWLLFCRDAMLEGNMGVGVSQNVPTVSKGIPA